MLASRETAVRMQCPVESWGPWGGAVDTLRDTHPLAPAVGSAVEKGWHEY